MTRKHNGKERLPEPVVNERAWLSNIEPALLQRLGNSRDRLRWLVEDFARRRNFLDKHSAPEALVREVALFLLYQNGAGTMPLSKMPRLSADGLQRLSSEIEAGVGRFVEGHDWTVSIESADQDLPVISRSVRRQTIELGRERGKRIVVSSWRSRRPTRTFLLSFLLAAQELVAFAHEFLAKCSGCGTVFVRDDLRQAYCTARCGATSRMRNHRGRKRSRPAEAPSKTHSVIDQDGVVHWPGT